MHIPPHRCRSLDTIKKVNKYGLCVRDRGVLVWQQTDRFCEIGLIAGFVGGSAQQAIDAKRLPSADLDLAWCEFYSGADGGVEADGCAPLDPNQLRRKVSSTCSPNVSSSIASG